MRRIHRGVISSKTRLAMYRRHRECVDGASTRKSWKVFRASKDSAPLVVELSRMAGVRNRCFYCSDSRAADVEHYVPISTDFRLAWRWANLLWVCPECNRKKAASFPIEDNLPLIIDPTAVDPWSHLALDVTSGVLAPRFLNDGTEDRIGAKTLEVLDILNFESLIESRARTIRRPLEAARDAAAGPDLPSTAGQLWRAVAEDDLGIAAWFAFWDGGKIAPYSTLRNSRPGLWRRFVRVVASARTG